MSQLTLGAAPTFNDISEDLLVAAQPLRQGAIQHISHNAKFGTVRKECIYEGFFKHGNTVPVSTSPIDGYVYSRAEITYKVMLFHTRQANGAFTPGQKGKPTVVFAQVANLYWWDFDIDDATGVVSCSVSYYKEGGAETITNHGIVKVYAICQRSSDNANNGSGSASGGSSGGGGTGGSGAGLGVATGGVIISGSGLIGGVNVQTGTTYTIDGSDWGKLIVFNSATAVAVTLPVATGFPDGFWFAVSNVNTGLVTITPATSTIDAATTRTVRRNMGTMVFSDSTNYFTQPGINNFAGVNSQTGTTYTVLISDFGKLITFNNGSPVAVTLPVATGFPTDFVFRVQNLGAGLVTITPTTSTIDGAATFTRSQNSGAEIASNGSNYFTQRGNPAGDTLPVVDTTAIVKGSGDATKLLRFEVDGFTTATTRVLTPLNKDYTVEETGHASKHQSAGADSIALDTLAVPTDIATLNSSTSAHGLLRKLDNTATHFLDGTGAWSTPTAAAVAWALGFNEDGSSLSNWTQVSGSWSVVSSAFHIDTGATTIRTLKYTARIAQGAIVFSADVKIESTGGFAADNRIGMLFHSVSAFNGTGGVLVTLRSTGALTPASTGVIYTEQPAGSIVGPTGLTNLFNLDTYYNLKVVAIGPTMDVYVDGVYKYSMSHKPDLVGNPSIEHSYLGLYAYNCRADFKNILLYSVALP